MTRTELERDEAHDAYSRLTVQRDAAPFDLGDALVVDARGGTITLEEYRRRCAA